MIETLISSKTRIKLLLKFFLNPLTKSYLRSLETEFDESSNAIRLELNRFEKAGMLTSDIEGNKKFFTANTRHPMFSNLQQIVRKYVGVDTIVDNIAKELGELEELHLTGDLAKGRNSNMIDLEFTGVINTDILLRLIGKAEELINKKIRYVIFKDTEESAACRNAAEARLLLWSRN